MSATEADREKARELQAKLGWEEFAEPTPQQLLDFIRQCSDVIGLEMAGKFLTASHDAHRCWEFDHEGQIGFWRNRAEQLLAKAQQ